MKIAINVSWMMPGRAGGMEWYVRALIQQLGVLDKKNSYLVITSPMNDQSFASLPSSWERLVYRGEETNPISFRRTPPPHHSHRPPHLDQMLRQEGVDLLFCPLMYALPSVSDIPTVVTIPDLQHEALPELFDGFEIGSRNLGFPAVAKEATAVLGISDHVANEVRRAFPISPERVFATPLGLTPDFELSDDVVGFYRESVRAQFRIDEPFLFFPGNAWPHKNHAGLIEGFEAALEEQPSLRLVFTGSRDVGELIPARLRRRIRHLGYVSRESLIGLTAEAAALVFPSRFEGFGLPLLEAMAVGTAIACSDLPTLREVGGDVPLYFDPEDTASIARALLQISSSPAESERQRSIAAEQLAKFDYAETARRTLEVFEKIRSGELVPPSGVRAHRPLDGNQVMYDGQARWTLTSPELRTVNVEAVAIANAPDGRSHHPRRLAVAVDNVMVGELRLETGGTSRSLEAHVPDWLTGQEIHELSLYDLSSETAMNTSMLRIASLSVDDGHFGEVQFL